MKTLTDWPRVKRVLEGALACDGAELQAYLAEACGADAALRAQVETLLAARDHAGDLPGNAGGAAARRTARRRISAAAS